MVESAWEMVDHLLVLDCGWQLEFFHNGSRNTNI